MKKILLFGCLLLLVSILRSQIIFQKAITGPNIIAKSVEQTSDNGFLIGGYNYYDSTFLVKTDNFGNIQWTKGYATSGSPIRMIQAGECVGGGYYIFGEILDSAFILIKTAINGDVLWSNKIPNTELGYGFSKIRSTADGGFLISESFFFKMGVLKLDANGNVLWNKSYSDDPSDQSIKCPSFNCFINNDGSMLFTGKRTSDILIVKTDSSGNLLWSSTLGSNQSYYHTYGITNTADGGYVVCGLNNPTTGMFYPFIMKINSTGTLLWYHEVIAANAVEFNEVFEQVNGNLVAIGTDIDSLTIFVTFDGNGIVLDSKSFINNICYEYPDISPTSYGGFVFVTNYYDQSLGYSVLVLMKTDTSGIFSCDFNNFLSMNNTAQIIPSLINIPIYTHNLTSTAFPITFNAFPLNATISDYCVLFGQNDQTIDPTYLSIFPSPVSEGENIHLELKGKEASSVSIFDVSGKLIKIIQGNLNMESPLKIQTNDLKSGIYFIRVTDTNEILLGTSRFIVK